MIGGVIDTFFIGLIVVVFGTIFWYNIVEITKARRRLKECERASTKECKS